MNTKAKSRSIGRLLPILFLVPAFCQVQAEEVPERIRIMPDVNMMIEAGAYSPNKADYSAKSQRLIHAEVLRRGNFCLGLEFSEETILGGADISGDDPYNLRHRPKYFELRYDGWKRDLSLFYKHTCINGINRLGGERGWDILGLQLETKNMRTGCKNEGLRFDAESEFEFLSRLGSSISLGRVVHERSPEAEAVGEVALRWDILRYRNYVPYLEAETCAIFGSSVEWDYSLEFGTRINYARAFLAPFIRYSCEHNVDRWEGMSEHFFMAGLRLETLAGRDSSGSQKQSGVLPQIHMEGYRAYLIGADDFNWDNGVTLNIELCRGENVRIFLNTDMDFLSPSGDYRPRFLTYRLEPGIGIDGDGKFLEFVFRHSSRYDVNASDGFAERSSLIGLRRGTIGMKTGHKNEGVDFASPKRFEFLKKIDWEISAGRYIYTSDYDYDWDAEIGLRWDILRHLKKIPYVEGHLNFLSGEALDIEYYVEAGVRCHGVGDITFFSRFQHRENVDRFGGYDEDYLLAGVRLEF